MAELRGYSVSRPVSPRSALRSRPAARRECSASKPSRPRPVTRRLPPTSVRSTRGKAAPHHRNDANERARRPRDRQGHQGLDSTPLGRFSAVCFFGLNASHVVKARPGVYAVRGLRLVMRGLDAVGEGSAPSHKWPGGTPHPLSSCPPVATSYESGRVVYARDPQLGFLGG